MGLFGKKVSDQEWKAGVSRAADLIREICDVLETTGKAVELDPVTGWMTVAEPLSSFKAYEARFRAAKAIYHSAGTPRSLDSLVVTAKRSLDAFFSLAGLAFSWGKFHYSDSSGGPGQRAREETGFAQKAALGRVMNNGSKFAANALSAAKAGRAALELVSLERYEGTGPGLMELFASSIEAGSRLLRQRSMKYSEVAMIGCWCFKQAAILGMVVSRDPDEFIPMVWNPSKIDRFWEHVDGELDRIDQVVLERASAAQDSAALGADTSLGYIRLMTEYRDIYLVVDAFAAAVAARNLRELARPANSRVSLADALMRWPRDTAIGLGLGILRPDSVRACLEAAGNPDRESWAQAHKAGLNIPPEPDLMSADEQTESVLQICRLFFQEYYPQAKAKLDELTA